MVTIFIIIFTLLSPLLSFPVSLYSIYRDNKHWRVYIFSLAMFFAAMSYCYTPLNETDLTRYWIMVQQISGMDFSYAVFNAYAGGNIVLYTFNFMAWIVGRLGDLHLLSAISTFAVYYTAFYITCYIGENSKNEWKYVFRYLIFIMCVMSWYSVANNVRNIMAFSVVGFAVFRDVYQKKRDLITVILYAVSIFIHPTAIIFIAIRLVLNITAKLKIIFLIAVAFVTPIINFIYNTFMGITSNSLITWVINRAYFYFNDNSSEWGLAVQASGFQTFQRIVYVSLALVFCVYFILNSYQFSRKIEIINTDSKTANFQSFAFITGLLAISCVAMLRPEYWRFASALIIFGGIIYIPFAESEVSKKISAFINTYSCALCAVCVAMCMIRTSVRGLADIFSSMIFTCPLFIFFKDLMYLMRH